MKELALTSLALVVLATAAVVVRAEPYSEFEALHPGGAAFDKADRFEVLENEELELSDDTEIYIDEVIINGTIITKGKRLMIDARRLVFGPKGRILGYTEEHTPSTPTTAGTGETGREGENKGKKQGDGGTGHKGGEGKRGADGVDGDQNPGEIRIFAAEVVGVPDIEAVGQNGGKGGQGGEGGRGGQGGHGGAGEAQCWPWPDTSAGDGGRGGRGGKGGRGGDGGRGGKAIPVAFSFSSPKNTIDFSKILSKAGTPGEHGDGGDKGKGGPGGGGGSGDSSNCVFSTDEVDGGAKGGDGAEGPKGDEGNVGKVGEEVPPALTDLHDIEKGRQNVFVSWYGFHWARALNLMIRDSILLALDTEVTRDKVDELDPTDQAVLAAINADYAASISLMWRDHFLVPLERIEKSPIEGVNIAELKAIGKQVVRLLDDLASGQQGQVIKKELHRLLSRADVIFQDKLDNAATQCRLYLEAQKKNYDDVVGQTVHFKVPVCLAKTNFLDDSNLAKPIELTESMKTKILPKSLLENRRDKNALVANKLDTETAAATPWQSLKRLMFGLLDSSGLLPTAYAAGGDDEPQPDDYAIYVVQNKPFTVKSVRQGEPRRTLLVDNAGVLTGYVATQKTTLKTLAYHLHVLAVQAGARQ